MLLGKIWGYCIIIVLNFKTTIKKQLLTTRKFSFARRNLTEKIEKLPLYNVATYTTIRNSNSVCILHTSNLKATIINILIYNNTILSQTRFTTRVTIIYPKRAEQHLQLVYLIIVKWFQWR